MNLTYRDAMGKIGEELLHRHDEARIEIVEVGRPWSFDGDGAFFRLASEAHRIRLGASIERFAGESRAVVSRFVAS